MDYLTIGMESIPTYIDEFIKKHPNILNLVQNMQLCCKGLLKNPLQDMIRSFDCLYLINPYVSQFPSLNTT